MHDRTDLAAGVINGHDRLVIELIEPPDPMPPMVAINWPAKPTACRPAELDAVVAAAMRLLANPMRDPAALVALRGVRFAAAIDAAP